MIRAGVCGTKIIIETDDPSVKSLLEYTHTEKKYNFIFKQWRDTKVHGKIYDRTKLDKATGHTFFELGLGWAAYVLGVFRDYLILDDVQDITSAVKADSYRTIPFPELRDYQNDDVLHLLKYKIGLFTCYTGYGKSQVIATLANYAYRDLGQKVLLLAPGKKAKEELVKRCKNVFGLDIPSSDGRIKAMITNGISNSKKYKDPAQLEAIKQEMATYDWVLADEVEYCISPGGIKILDMLTGVRRFYGFSGTSDKTAGQMISFVEGLSKCVTDNRDLVKYFGPSLVYRLPLHLSIDLVSVRTSSLDHVDLGDLDNEGNIYAAIMGRIWSNPTVCQTIVKVAKHYPMLFIPINSLVEVITNWIENYFIGKLRVLLISGEGYIYYDIMGNRQKIDLGQACDYIRNGMVDIIPSTSSGYRALDFPGLENIFLIQGAIAGVVLQCIGRVARGSHMNIISLDPLGKTKIPVYTKGRAERRKMIQEYYKYCNITESEILERDLQNNLSTWRIENEKRLQSEEGH
jgi:hypothetical protein